MVETGLIVAGSSLLTLILSKFKCFVRKNGKITWGMGFLDRSLLDTDELEVKEFDLGDVKGIYVKPKHVIVHEPIIHHSSSSNE